MAEDEPGFLGHGSGYALAGASWRFQPDEHKLIVAVVGSGSRLDGVIEQLDGLRTFFQDDVTGLIAKPNMASPQPVNHFIHLWFDTEDAARSAATQIAKHDADDVALGIYAVRVIRFI